MSAQTLVVDAKECTVVQLTDCSNRRGSVCFCASKGRGTLEVLVRPCRWLQLCPLRRRPLLVAAHRTKYLSTSAQTLVVDIPRNVQRCNQLQQHARWCVLLWNRSLWMQYWKSYYATTMPVAPTPPAPTPLTNCGPQDYRNECSNTRGCKTTSMRVPLTCKNSEDGVCCCSDGQVCGCL